MRGSRIGIENEVSTGLRIYVKNGGSSCSARIAFSLTLMVSLRQAQNQKGDFDCDGAPRTFHNTTLTSPISPAALESFPIQLRLTTSSPQGPSQGEKERQWDRPKELPHVGLPFVIRATYVLDHGS